jgi:preprotein translocase subunit SecG
MSRATATLAALFFATNLALAYMGGRKDEAPSSVVDKVQTPAPAQENQPPPLPNAPAAPESTMQQPVEPPAQGESQAPQAPKQ